MWAKPSAPRSGPGSRSACTHACRVETFSTRVSRRVSIRHARVRALLSDDGVAELSDAFDSHDALISRLQPALRPAREAHASRRSRGYDIARFKRHHLGDVLDQFRNLEDQLTRVGALQ